MCIRDSSLAPWSALTYLLVSPPFPSLLSLSRSAQEAERDRLQAPGERSVQAGLAVKIRIEKQNFYRAVSSFGVDCLDRRAQEYALERFKEIGQLDKKLNDTLADYFNVFAMCACACATSRCCLQWPKAVSSAAVASSARAESSFNQEIFTSAPLRPLRPPPPLLL